MPEAKKDEPVLGKDISWNVVDHHMLRVLEFSPFLSTVEGKSIKLQDRFVPYALLTVEDTEKSFDGKAVIYVTHKEDFMNLWKVFKEIGVKQNEEVIVVWSKNHYTNWVYKLLSAIMPKMQVMIFTKESRRLWTDNDYKPELDGLERHKARKPVVHLKPKVIEGSNLAAT